MLHVFAHLGHAPITRRESAARLFRDEAWTTAGFVVLAPPARRDRQHPVQGLGARINRQQ